MRNHFRKGRLSIMQEDFLDRFDFSVHDRITICRSAVHFFVKGDGGDLPRRGGSAHFGESLETVEDSFLSVFVDRDE